MNNSSNKQTPQLEEFQKEENKQEVELQSLNNSREKLLNQIAQRGAVSSCAPQSNNCMRLNEEMKEEEGEEVTAHQACKVAVDEMYQKSASMASELAMVAAELAMLKQARDEPLR